MQTLTVWDAYLFGLLPLMMYREARNQPDEAIIGVAWVAQNRAARPGWWGEHGIPSVILAPYQFSSFNPGNPQERVFIEQGPEADHILDLAFKVYWKTIPDPTGGATYYHDDSITKPAEWGDNIQFTVKIGNLLFYKETP